MRKGDFKIFYTPVVYNPETQSSEPLANGGTADAFLGMYGWSIGQMIPRDSLRPSMTEPTNPMPVITIDPLSIPLASFASQIKDDGGTYGDDARQLNLLTVLPNDGLHVEAYREAHGVPISGGAYSKLVTVNNLHSAFVDCNNTPLNSIFDENNPHKTTSIATCENLNGLVDRITQMVMDIISQQLDSIRQEFDSKFDGSNATKDVIPGAQDVPYTPPDNYTTIPYTYRNAIVRKEAHEYESTPVLINDSQLQVGTVYAIDMYGTIGQDEKTYKGTLYKVATSTHRVPGKHVSLSERKSETSSHFSYDVQTQHYVLRTLKPGENAVVTP